MSPAESQHGTGCQGDFHLSLATTAGLAMFAENEAIFRTAVDRLGAWTEWCQPLHDVAPVRSAIEAIRGTVVEPFRLSTRVRDVVAMLVRAAFSRRHRMTRFRVVSEECLGVRGGAVLTNNLEHYYVERFCLGQRRRDPAKGWSVAPLAGRQILAGTPGSRITGTIELDASGLTIRAAGIGGPGRLVTIDGEPLSQRQFSIDSTPKETRIGPSGSESALKLLAHSMRGSIVAIRPRDETAGPHAFYKLVPPEEERPTELPAVTGLHPDDFTQWLSAETSTGPLKADAQALVRAGMTVPLPWIPDLLKESS